MARNSRIGAVPLRFHPGPAMARLRLWRILVHTLAEPPIRNPHYGVAATTSATLSRRAVVCVCVDFGAHRPVFRIVHHFTAMATAASCALATSAAGAVVASQAPRNHGAPVRPCSNAAFVNSELFSSTAALSARGVAASRPVPSRRSSVQVVCGKINKGDIVPPVGLRDQDGKLVNLDEYRGKPLVLYFYPADETPGCTKQACAFRDSYEKFKRAGAEVVGVSGDTPESHKAFKAKYRLPFTLLSDEDNRLRKDWGIPSDFFGSLAGRQTYVIDKDGRVQLVFNNQFEPEKHIVETLAILQG